jgi:hypothetical protein
MSSKKFFIFLVFVQATVVAEQENTKTFLLGSDFTITWEYNKRD